MTETGREGKRKSDGWRIAAGGDREFVWIQEFRKRHNGKVIAAKA